MTDAIGPIYAAGGFEAFELNENGEGYRILYLPDKNNDKLQLEGKAPIYYWVPANVRLARSSDTGDYKFQHIHFAGNPELSGVENVVGGNIIFSTTISYPPAVLKASQDKLLEKFRGKDNKYWGVNSNVSPEFRIVPITNNITQIQNNDISWKLDGEGPGNITGGENTYSGTLNAMNSEILWGAFHGAFGGIGVQQILQIPVWTEVFHLKITGKWKKIYDHFSTHSTWKGWYGSTDIKTELNNLRTNGGIQVEIRVDGTSPSSDEMKKMMEQHEELIMKQFMEQATKIIFEPAPPTPEAAKANRGFWGFGGGFALKSITNITTLELNYEETVEFRYNLEFPISGMLEGFYNIIKNNPDEESKYFKRIFLGELIGKIPIISNCVVNWPDIERNFAGDPVSHVSLQIGYPSTNGDIIYQTHIFKKGESNSWIPEILLIKKKINEVTNPPEGWKPEKVYIKRTIYFIEQPSESEFSFTRIFIENNLINLDLPNGTLTDEYSIDVRADMAGLLDVGPIILGADMNKPNQMIEVEFQSHGKTLDGRERPITKMLWKYETRSSEGKWKIYTGQMDYKQLYRYRVRVIEKAIIGENDGAEWQGEWQECSGNGSLILKIPPKL